MYSEENGYAEYSGGKPVAKTASRNTVDGSGDKKRFAEYSGGKRRDKNRFTEYSGEKPVDKTTSRGILSDKRVTDATHGIVEKYQL